MHRPFGSVLTGLALLPLFAAITLAQPAEPQPTVSGAFEVVSIRRAGDVAGGPVDQTAGEALGTTVSFGDTLTWVDGATCEDWSLVSAGDPAVSTDDPILSDLSVPPVDGPASTGDKRQEQHLEINCGGSALATLLKVDDRVLVTPSRSGLSYIILERSLTPEQINAFQTQLRSMKFLEGETQDSWTDESLQAVAAYAEYRGGAYRFQRAAITENLLDGLKVISSADGWQAIKVVYMGPAAAYFYGEEIELFPREYGTRLLAFRFDGDDREYAFQPSGTVEDTDWSFDIVSPGGSQVLLLQDHYGPYHVIAFDRLKAYLTGEAEPDHVIGHDGTPARVHSEARWLNDNEIQFKATCCGETETVTRRLAFSDYTPKLSDDTVLDYRPALAQQLDNLPPITLGTFSQAIIHLSRLNSVADQAPGEWRNGNVALGADPQQYHPSEEELLAAAFGDSLAAFMKDLSGKDIATAWTGKTRMPYPPSYKRFDFRHVDVMGSGRFFYASAPQDTVIQIPAYPADLNK